MLILKWEITGMRLNRKNYFPGNNLGNNFEDFFDIYLMIIKKEKFNLKTIL